MTEKYEEKLSEILSRIGQKAALEQAVEECGEFIQAAAKHLRIMRGVNYTPVSLVENNNNLLEEVADVSVCLDLLSLSFDKDGQKAADIIGGIKDAKTERWLSRLKEHGV